MPGEFKTLVKSPVERMKEFNERLEKACKSAPITGFEAAVVDGQPVVTLMSELDYPSDEQLADDKEAKGDLKADDLVPIDDPICVQIGGIAASENGPAQTEHAHDTLNNRAQGECTEVRYISGQHFVWTPDQNDVLANVPKPKQVLVQTTVVFAAVAYLQEPALAEAKAAPAK